MILCAALAVAACAQVDYQPYEGRNATAEGQGGTRRTTGGIDIWSNGAPPRRYQLLGVVSVDLNEGIGHDAVVNGALASRVKRAGGDAAILMDADRSMAGVAPVGMMLVAVEAAHHPLPSHPLSRLTGAASAGAVPSVIR